MVLSCSLSYTLSKPFLGLIGIRQVLQAQIWRLNHRLNNPYINSGHLPQHRQREPTYLQVLLLMSHSFTNINLLCQPELATPFLNPKRT
jgi:hypothetical protein